MGDQDPQGRSDNKRMGCLTRRRASKTSRPLFVVREISAPSPFSVRSCKPKRESECLVPRRPDTPNIFVTRTGHCCGIDIGLARLSSSAAAPQERFEFLFRLLLDHGLLSSRGLVCFLNSQLDLALCLLARLSSRYSPKLSRLRWSRRCVPLSESVGFRLRVISWVSQAFSEFDVCESSRLMVRPNRSVQIRSCTPTA